MNPVFSLIRSLVKNFKLTKRRAFLFSICAFVTISVTGVLFAQNSATRLGATKAAPRSKNSLAPKEPKSLQKESKEAAQQIPLFTRTTVTGQGITETVAEIMAGQKEVEKQNQGKPQQIIVQPEPQEYEEDNSPPNPNAPQGSQYPPLKAGEAPVGTLNPQTVGTSFLGTQISDTIGFVPPDSNGDVGPTQIVVCSNGIIKSFTKSTGVADGVLNADTDTFFNSVRNGSGTSDPRVKYDRLSQRWFIVMINVANSSNRCMIAVSSGSNITGTGSFTFFQFVPNSGMGNFADYPTLGIDNSALYIGYNTFHNNSFLEPDGSVLNKAQLIAGTLSGTTFLNLGASIQTPQGVDNDDPAATEGYFIGCPGSTLSAIRVSNPGGSPTLTALTNISIVTASAIAVPAQGSTHPLDSLNRRLYAARLHKNKITGVSTLWTAHNIQVDATGTPSTAPGGRMASRWYEVTGLNTATPSIVQMGTVFDSAASNPRNFWIPSVMMSGQGHMALGCSFAGNNDQPGIAVTGRLRTDTLGTTQAVTLTQPGGGTYNAQSVSVQRWGDYSIVSVDPNDDQTLWTFQEYCNANNSWGVRVLQLKAPPPATPSSTTPLAPTAGCVAQGQTRNVQINGTSASGSEFFDPGADTGGPGYTNHIQASVSGTGVTVNSVTFNSPTQLTINVTVSPSAALGSRDVTITNPDGQTATGVGIFCIQAPTEVKLDAFRATGYDDGRVMLQWQTGREADNLGFNIYREENGQRAKITPTVIGGSALLAGKGVALESGQAYSWTDTPQNREVKYWLEDIDLKGKSSWHGPFTIESAKGNYPNQRDSELLTRLNWRLAQMNLQGSAPVERIAEPASRSASLMLQNPLASQSAMKISITREGWYRITQRELTAGGFNAKVDPRMLQLFADGQEIAFTVAGESDGRFDAEDYIEFYAMGLDTPATNRHVYWLTVGNQPGRRIQTLTSKPAPVASDSYPAVVERKDRSIYFASLRNGDEENFFGAIITASPVDQTLSLRNINRNAKTTTVEVILQGVTQTQHSVAISLNGISIGKMEFSEQMQGVAHLQAPSSLLREGENVVSLSAQGGATDVSLVASIRIIYAHNYVADNNTLRFTATAGQTVTISGFTNPSARVFDITDPNGVQELRGIVTGSTTSITVTPQGTGQRLLLALTSDRADSPAAITPNIISNWRSAKQGADLVMVTRRDFTDALASLKALRERQGLSVAVVDIEDVYDEFNFGNKSPQALKDFFAFAKANWQRPPRFILLGGDASYDPRNYLGYGDTDIVPTRLLDTTYLETASDDWLVDFDNNGIGDVAIGRLPARSMQEIAGMAAKIVRYENGGGNSKDALLVSDDNDGFNFDNASAQVKPLLVPYFNITELQRSRLGDETRSRLLAALNAGAKIVNYTGHGSVTMWRGNLLNTEDARTLNNEKSLSVFVTMTCLNGYFDNAAGVSLAASLMQARHGAVAVWSSTALTLPNDQMVINQEFYRALFAAEPLTIGEAALRAKAATNNADVRRSWTFFGDPAMRLR